MKDSRDPIPATCPKCFKSVMLRRVEYPRGSAFPKPKGVMQTRCACGAFITLDCEKLRKKK